MAPDGAVIDLHPSFITYHDYGDYAEPFSDVQDWAVTNLRTGRDSQNALLQTARPPFNGLNYALSEWGCEVLTRSSVPTAHGYLSETWGFMQNKLYGGQTLYAKGLRSAYWYRDQCGASGAKAIFYDSGGSWVLTTPDYPVTSPCDPAEALPCCGTTLRSL